MPTFTVEIWRTVHDIESVQRTVEAPTIEAAREAAAALADEFDSEWPEDAKCSVSDSDAWQAEEPYQLT